MKFEDIVALSSSIKESQRFLDNEAIEFAKTNPHAFLYIQKAYDGLGRSESKLYNKYKHIAEQALIEQGLKVTEIFPELAKYPMLMTSNHLVELGLYTSIDAAYAARIRGYSPKWIQFKRKILYPKHEVFLFLKGMLDNGKESN